ncbi:expressed unknown protein [Seminavis robusta]|uniref:Uncharacterized protein n=1 Tax=Seminavis robusta TaxID=568900 RepID=A0A9N8HUE6_9STRA|nr:expressed unknown protein [Seminavis robusta]|eukprot:Sro1805_g298760.1 n/a (287) ;mRNA; r:4769-5629
MKTFSQVALLLSFLAAAASTTQAAHLRSTAVQEQNQEQETRNMQLINAELLNALISTYLAPEIDVLLQTVLGNNFDPIYLGEETTIQTEELELALPPNGIVTCRSSASITYGVGYITGLSSIQVNALEMVPGSETINVGMENILAGPSATWNGTWLVNATLEDLTAETSVTFRAQACGIPLEQKVTGITTFQSPSLQASMTLGGDTGNLILMTSTTEITTAQFESFNLEFGSIDAGIELGGTVIPTFALGDSFDAFLLNSVVNRLEPRIVDLVNQALSGLLPISLQ